jgi:hypothetical protein
MITRNNAFWRWLLDCIWGHDWLEVTSLYPEFAVVEIRLGGPPVTKAYRVFRCSRCDKLVRGAFNRAIWGILFEELKLDRDYDPPQWVWEPYIGPEFSLRGWRPLERAWKRGEPVARRKAKRTADDEEGVSDLPEETDVGSLASRNAGGTWMNDIRQAPGLRVGGRTRGVRARHRR